MNIETLIYVGSTTSLALFGYFMGVLNAREARADPLAYLESARASLQCIRGVNGTDDTWAVTDGEHKVIGTPQYTPRAAIASAAGGADV